MPRATRPSAVTTSVHQMDGQCHPREPAFGKVPPRPVRKKRSLEVFLVVEASEPGGQAVHGGLEAGVEVDEVAQPLGQPGDGDLLVASPVRQFLDAAVGEVHAGAYGIAFSSSAVWDAACWA